MCIRDRLSPYENTSDCGVLYYSDEKVTEFCKAANRAGLQIEMHAIGDKAFVQAVRAIKAALDDLPREDPVSYTHLCGGSASGAGGSRAFLHADQPSSGG